MAARPRIKTRSQSKANKTLIEKSKSLYCALRERNIQKADNFLKAGAKPDFINIDDNMGFTTFHAASPEYDEEEEQEIHIKLLNMITMSKYNNNHHLNKLDIFSPDSYGMNAFECAIADGLPLTTQWFIDILQKSEFGYTEKANDIINRQNPFPDCFPEEKCKRKHKQTPIQLAVKSESISTVRVLCEFRGIDGCQPDVGITNGDGMNAIHMAIKRLLPYILYEIVRIAKKKHLEVVNYDGFNALKYAQLRYKQLLMTVALPSDIKKALQCKDIIEARLNGQLTEKWESIKKQQDPTHNAIMTFWDRNNDENPNTNIYHKNTPNKVIKNKINDDIDKLKEEMNDKKDKYRVVTFEEACNLQHENEKWITTHHGALNTSERFVKKQKLSPFTQQFKTLYNKHREQMGISYESELDEQQKMDASNTRNCKIKRISSPLFKYKDKWIKVEAINNGLEEELTEKDRIKFYKLSIGEYESNEDIEICQILDPCHPCKRDNIDNDGIPVFGLFAKRDISKKTIIMEYCGKMLTVNEYKSQINGFERFDGKWRTHIMDTFKDPDGVNTFLINASYYSNESVFVNDATHDDIFGKWSKQNVSFFEIVINNHPHIFLRAFEDIKKGSELLTGYGSCFWKNFGEDMKTRKKLNDYYQHRLMRQQQVKQLKVTQKRNKLIGQKRKRNNNNNNNNNDNNNNQCEMNGDCRDIVCDLEPQRKRRKINMLTVEKGNDGIADNMNDNMNDNNNNNNNDMMMFMEELKATNNTLKELINGDVDRSNMKELCLKQLIDFNSNLMGLFVKSQSESFKEINRMKLENQRLKTQNINSEPIIKELSNKLPEIIKNSQLLQEKCKNQEIEIAELKEMKGSITEKWHECVRKKKKYKDKCRQLIDESIIYNAEEHDGDI